MVVPVVEPSDETLAARAAAGDNSAFETLVQRYQARVFRLACRLTSDTEAPDVLQDTFLQVYRHLPSFRGESQFATWLYRIATNAALMHRRATARRPAESLEAFLPRFDADGTHAATPAQLQVASCADEMLDRQTLAEVGVCRRGAVDEQVDRLVLHDGFRGDHARLSRKAERWHHDHVLATQP